MPYPHRVVIEEQGLRDGIQAEKLFLTTGRWDDVHPAAMVILGFAALISVALRKSFCGWF